MDKCEQCDRFCQNSHLGMSVSQTYKNNIIEFLDKKICLYLSNYIRIIKESS